MRLKRIVRRAIACAIGSFALAAVAQPFPNKPIRIVIPFPAGGTADSQTRALAEGMQAILKQPVIVEARPGAGGVVATRYVIGQPADGYTLISMSNGSVIRSAVPNPPFDVRKDLASVGLFVESPIAIAVNAEFPARTLGEIVDLARSSPGKINFSSFGHGTMAHLIIEYIAQTRGVKMVHVPYKGSTDEVTALTRGDTQAGMNALSAYRSGASSGKLRLIAVTSAERISQAPGVPGMREAGFPGVDIPGWNGFSAPAGTPVEALERLNTAMNQALADPSVKDQLTKLGVSPAGGSRDLFTQRIAREVVLYEGVIRSAGIQIE